MWIQKNDTILFQGDSITNAFRMPQEISNAYQMGAGWAMICAARLLAERPHDGLTVLNRGVSGNTVEALSDRWQADCIDLKPTVVSILVGVNETLRIKQDPSRQRSPQAYKSAYHDLLLRTRDALPTVRLILCEPFLLPVGIITPSDVDHLRARATMVRELAETFGALFVPLQDRFDQASQEAPADHWLFDGIHPHAPGQWVIARAWLNAINGGGTPDNHPEMK